MYFYFNKNINYSINDEDIQEHNKEMESSQQVEKTNKPLVLTYIHAPNFTGQNNNVVRTDINNVPSNVENSWVRFDNFSGESVSDIKPVSEEECGFISGMTQEIGKYL